MRMRVWVGGLCSLLLCVVLRVLFSNAYVLSMRIRVWVGGVQHYLNTRTWGQQLGSPAKALHTLDSTCILMLSQLYYCCVFQQFRNTDYFVTSCLRWRHTWNENVKVDLKEVEAGCKGVCSVRRVQKRGQWQAVVNMINGPTGSAKLMESLEEICDY
jgi:hypothetical protein